jgi:hypothetical protein
MSCLPADPTGVNRVTTAAYDPDVNMVTQTLSRRGDANATQPQIISAGVSSRSA